MVVASRNVLVILGWGLCSTNELLLFVNICDLFSEAGLALACAQILGDVNMSIEAGLKTMGVRPKQDLLNSACLFIF